MVKRRPAGGDDAASGSKRSRGSKSKDDSSQGSDPLQSHPMNKDGFRYTVAEEDPFTPNSWRPCGSNGTVVLSGHDRAAQLKLSADRLGVTGDKGYCMVRASHGVSHGTWYFEATVGREKRPGEPDSHCRLGWSQKFANLQVPCGFDCFSYSYRDISGTKFHVSRGTPYGAAYGPGDTIGFLIHLPLTQSTGILPRRSRTSKAFAYKGSVYFEENEIMDKSKLLALKGSRMECFKNGESQGVMFSDVYEGEYFPTASLYYGATVTMNFGPDFKYQPSAPARPYCDAVHRRNAELTLADIVGKVENGMKALDQKAAKPAAKKEAA